MAPPPVAGRTRSRSFQPPTPPVRARDEESKLDGRSRSTVGKKRVSGNASEKMMSGDGFDTSKSGSNALFSGLMSSSGDEEGEPEVMMKKKRVREGERGKEGKGKKRESGDGCSEGKKDDLILISDSDDEEQEGDLGENEKSGSCSESETEYNNGVRRLFSSDTSFSSEDEREEKGKGRRKGRKIESGSAEQKETGSGTKKQRKNEREKNEKEKERKEKKGKEKMTKSESVHMNKPTKIQREKEEADKRKDKGKQKQTESETAKRKGKEKQTESETVKDKGKQKQTESETVNDKGKQKQTESVSAKQKGKEKRTVSASVKTGWDTHIRENGIIEKKRQRKQNPPEFCVAWRTRSYSKKDPNRVDYRQFYSNKVKVNSDEVVNLDSDSETDSEPDSESDSESRLKMIVEEEEEESGSDSDSDSDSESYTDSDEYSDSESDSDSSESKEEMKNGSKGKSSDREREKYLKSERRRKRKYRHERRRKYKKEESFESPVSSDSETDEQDPLNNGFSSDGTSMDDIPLTERMKMNREKMHNKKMAREMKQRKKRARERKERKKYRARDTDSPLEKKERKKRGQEMKQRKKSKARDNDKRDPEQNENNSEKKERKKRDRKNEKAVAREDLMEYIMNNMNEEEKNEIEEELPEGSRRGNSPREFPMVFRWETSEESNGSEKSLEEAWKDYDFALGLENLGTYNADEAQGGPCSRENKDEEFYKGIGDYCENGAHEMYLDEQVGYRCALCSYVQTEIRYVMPDFAKNAYGPTVPKNPTNLTDLLNFDLQSQSQNPDEPGPSRTNTGTVWDLIPGIYRSLYLHQQEAFEFMWRNLAGSIRIDELKSGAHESDDQVGGCVVSHAPGTGKTRLAIVFIQSYMKIFPDSNPVVIAPAGMMLTWENEFRKWRFGFPFHNMNSEDFTGKEDTRVLQLTRGEPRSTDLARKVKLSSWVKGKCVLGISYSLFNKYISHKSNFESKERKVLIEEPGLLILDEGHIPRNEKSRIWNAFSEVKTNKRIILSGTPFQNNFLELYNSLCIVRPKFAQKFDIEPKGKKKKKEKDMWTTTTENITPQIVEEARRILMPFVHVHAGSILQSLPGLRECVIMLRPEKMQNETLVKFNKLKKSHGTFDMDFKMSLAAVHPALLACVSSLTEIEKETLNAPMLKTLKSDPYEGVKTKFVVEFVRLCDALKERVLIFSQYLEPLKIIKKHLMTIFNWMEGDEVLQIYGKIYPNVRQEYINKFNNMSSEARVLLASTKACSEGISLTGASRVVLLDVVWNPSVGKQAISRAFRIGQEKVVYTYNLITTGTGEMEKYDVQGKKEELSKLVFSPICEGGKSKNKGFLKGWNEKDGDACKMVCEDRVLEEITENEKLKDIFENIYYIKSDEFHD